METVFFVLPHKRPAAAREVERALHHHKIADVHCFNVGALYALSGTASESDLLRVANELLCDPVAEEIGRNSPAADNQTIFVDVWYKRGVTDVTADSVLKAVSDLGLSSLKKAAAGKRYVFHLKNSKKRAAITSRLERFAEKELLNPLVQECRIS